MPSPSRTTLWRMKKRGGNWNPAYHEKTQTIPSMENWENSGGTFDAYRIAHGVWKTRLAPYFENERDDLQQEIALRLFELSGHPRFPVRKWRWIVAVNTMRSYLDRQRFQNLIFIGDPTNDFNTDD